MLIEDSYEVRMQEECEQKLEQLAGELDEAVE